MTPSVAVWRRSPECERIVVVNDGTSNGRNVNIGFRFATGDYIAVVNNDCRVEDGDVYDLRLDGTVTSPLPTRF